MKVVNLAWFPSYLTNRIQYLSITRDLETDTKNICCRVPQGWILGPLLFLLYINDLHNWRALDPIISADDTNLFYEHNNLKTLFSLVNQELQKTNDTARKTIFSFSRCPEKMVFPKGAVLVHGPSCIIWRDGIFCPKTWSFFPGQKAKDGLSQEIHGNMMHRPAKKKQETWYIGSKFGLSLNLFGWRYSTMNNLQYFVTFSPQELCLGACLRANKGNHLSIRG